MERLTKEALKDSYVLNPQKDIPTVIVEGMIYDKLGKLEDIEEESNIDIIAAIELCKKVNEQGFVYTKENWGIDTVKLIDKLDVEILHNRLYVDSCGLYHDLPLNDYGVWWALTKEELE